MRDDDVARGDEVRVTVGDKLRINLWPVDNCIPVRVIPFGGIEKKTDVLASNELMTIGRRWMGRSNIYLAPSMQC